MKNYTNNALKKLVNLGGPNKVHCIKHNHKQKFNKIEPAYKLCPNLAQKPLSNMSGHFPKA